MNMWQNIPPHHQISILGVKKKIEIFPLAWEEYSFKNLVLFPYSCSPAHVHAHRFMN
jgi:hypothetical protein